MKRAEGAGLRTWRHARGKVASERAEQAALIQWCKLVQGLYPELRWLFHTPNGLHAGSKAAAAKMVGQGMKRGVPDLLLPVRRVGVAIGRPETVYSGLAIEMKARGGRVPRDQKEWMSHLRDEGWVVAVCWSYEEAKGALLGYLALPCLSGPAIQWLSLPADPVSPTSNAPTSPSGGPTTPAE